MQTVNFNCPHCGNLMAVGPNLLGRNVRCPHCKQVVRAPAGPSDIPAPPMTPPPPPRPPTNLPSFNVPTPTEHHESIFGERHDEDVFGSEPPKPTLSSILPVSLPPTVDESYQPPPISSQPPPGNIDTLTYESPAHDQVPPLDEQPTSPGIETRDEDRGYRSRTAREPAAATPAFAWIILIYAALMTIAAGFFGFQYFTSDSNKGDHPFKAMPDVIREFDPAKKRQVSFKGMPDPKQEVPVDLRVKLGEQLTVGDLNVVPTSVDRHNFMCATRYLDKDEKTRPVGKRDGLVMKLRVKNISSDTIFAPNDPAFNRAADPNQPAPYTALQIQRNFFHGPFNWPPDPRVTKEFVVGYEIDEKPLGPGEECDTWVTVAPWGIRTTSVDVIDALEKLKPEDRLLWRVQLRRGIVKAKGAGGEDMDVSATTVIGVEFRVDQIR
jgi:hypothetical protein